MGESNEVGERDTWQKSPEAGREGGTLVDHLTLRGGIPR